MALTAGRRLVLSSSSPVHRHLTIHRHCNEPPCLHVLELDNLMPAPCELAPPAGLAWVLLNRCVLASLYGESDSPEALLASTADGEPLAFDLDLVGGQELLGDGA
jgi:hypothetical protein